MYNFVFIKKYLFLFFIIYLLSRRPRLRLTKKTRIYISSWFVQMEVINCTLNNNCNNGSASARSYVVLLINCYFLVYTMSAC